MPVAAVPAAAVPVAAVPVVAVPAFVVPAAAVPVAVVPAVVVPVAPAVRDVKYARRTADKSYRYRQAVRRIFRKTYAHSVSVG